MKNLKSENKKYNYFYNGTAIQRSRFINAVPENWEEDVDEFGGYTNGYYRAALREEEEKEDWREIKF